MPSVSWSQRRPSVDVGSVQLDWNGTILAMALSRLFDWGDDECRPVFDRAQFLAGISWALSFAGAEFSTLI